VGFSFASSTAWTSAGFGRSERNLYGGADLLDAGTTEAISSTGAKATKSIGGKSH
jgi:hypothetical protein